MTYGMLDIIKTVLRFVAFFMFVVMNMTVSQKAI
jgi:hypothetical protein